MATLMSDVKTGQAELRTTTSEFETVVILSVGSGEIQGVDFSSRVLGNRFLTYDQLLQLQYVVNMSLKHFEKD